MGQFNFEEINLICCYRKKTRANTVAAITAALPYMETELQELAEHSGKAEEADRGRICRACVFAC